MTKDFTDKKLIYSRAIELLRRSLEYNYDLNQLVNWIGIKHKKPYKRIIMCCSDITMDEVFGVDSCIDRAIELHKNENQLLRKSKVSKVYREKALASIQMYELYIRLLDLRIPNFKVNFLESLQGIETIEKSIFKRIDDIGDMVYMKKMNKARHSKFVKYLDFFESKLILTPINTN